MCSDRGARVNQATFGAHSSRRAGDKPGCAACRPASSSASSRRSNPTSSAPALRCARASGGRRSRGGAPPSRQRAPHRRDRDLRAPLQRQADRGARSGIARRRRGVRSGEPLRRGRPAATRANCSATCSARTAARSPAASTASARSASPVRTSAPAVAWRPRTSSARGHLRAQFGRRARRAPQRRLSTARQR